MKLLSAASFLLLVASLCYLMAMPFLGINIYNGIGGFVLFVTLLAYYKPIMDWCTKFMQE